MREVEGIMGEKELLSIAERLREVGVRELFIERIIEFARKLFEFIDVSGLLLFGSVARDRAHPVQSDIDLIVVSPQFDVPPIDKTSLRIDLSKRLPSGFDVIWLGEKEIISVFNAFTGVLLDALYE